MAAQTNTLTLYNAVGILHDLLDTSDAVRLCDNCGEELTGDTWNICTGPITINGKQSITNYHEGHTACMKCAMDPLAYIAEGGACRPCLNALGGRRSAVSKAGVALRPPVKNVLANKMIGCCNDAKQKVKDAQDAQDAERRQEGTDRRAFAVEEVRRRQMEREKETARLVQEKIEEDQRLTQKKIEEDQRLAQEKIEEDQRLTQEKIEEDQRLAQEKIEKDQRLAQEKIEEDKRLAKEAIEKDRRLAQNKINNEQRLAREKIETEHRLAQEKIEEDRRLAKVTNKIETKRMEPESDVSDTKSRKRKAQSEETINRRKEAARATREEKKRKLELYDSLFLQNQVLSRQLTKAREIAHNIIKSVGEDVAQITANVVDDLIQQEACFTLSCSDEEEGEDNAIPID